MAGAIIIGAGRGIGASVARRFARESLPLALVARSDETLATVAHTVAPFGVPVITQTADSGDGVALVAALDTVIQRLGVPEVVVYNVARVRADALGELSVRDHQDAWADNVVGAVTAAARTLPQMARRGHGSFLVTGGMPEPKPGYVSLSLGKAGVRTLVTLLDMEYAASGVHVASVTVTGPVAPGSAHDPDDIAEHFWTLHRQTSDQWETEICH